IFHDYDRFRVGAAGYLTSRDYLFSEIGRELELKLDRAPALTGTVLGRREKPLAEVLVTVKGGRDADGSAIAIEGSFQKTTVRTDTMGRFLIDWLPPGTFTLSFRLSGSILQPSRELEVA